MLTRVFLGCDAEADGGYATFAQIGTQTALRDTSKCRGKETNFLLEGVTSTERDKQLGTIPMET
jgi:hypothetical protein